MKLSHYFVLPFILILCNSCSNESPSKSNFHAPTYPEPTKRLNVGFVVVNGVYNSELMAPYDIFHHSIFHHELGMRVFSIAPDLGPIITFEGIKILPDYSLDSDDLPPIDVLVVASAEHSMDSDLDNKALIEFIAEKGNNAKFVLSLCDGAFVLAKAGLIENKVSTTFPADIKKYKEMFPQLEVKENVSFVHDQNLITSAGGAKSYDAALYICEILYGKNVAQGIASGLVIDWNLAQINYFTTSK